MNITAFDTPYLVYVYNCSSIYSENVIAVKNGTFKWDRTTEPTLKG